MLRWSDPSGPPSSYHILSNITLYYLTRTFATSMYPYWTSPVGRMPASVQPDSAVLKATKKPVGYSFFTKEIHPVPISWVDEDVGLAWSKRHEKVRHALCISHLLSLAGQRVAACKEGGTPGCGTGGC